MNSYWRLSFIHYIQNVVHQYEFSCFANVAQWVKGFPYSFYLICVFCMNSLVFIKRLSPVKDFSAFIMCIGFSPIQIVSWSLDHIHYIFRVSLLHKFSCFSLKAKILFKYSLTLIRHVKSIRILWCVQERALAKILSTITTFRGFFSSVNSLCYLSWVLTKGVCEFFHVV